MTHSLHIPQLIKNSNEFNTKEFQTILRNINLKLHCEFALVSITELVDIDHVKLLKIKNTQHFSITNFGNISNGSAEAKVNETDLSLNLSYCTIYFEESFKDLKPFAQKKIINQIKTKCQNIRGSLRGLSIKWWDNPLNTEIAKTFALKYSNGVIITHDIKSKNDFVNDFLPNNWGEYRHVLLEQEHFDNILENETKKQTVKKKI